MTNRIFVGWDPNEAAGFAVARHSLQRHMSRPIQSYGLVLSGLQQSGLYTRPIEKRDGQMWDVISSAPMSTEHACARFLVAFVGGWAMFCDGDVLFRTDVNELFDSLDPRYAIYCVKHRHVPNAAMKKHGQIQTAYPRKNWSSVFVVNSEHPANRALTVRLVNSLPGRDLHRFCWLNDDDIGELDPGWNFLVGHSDPSIEPKIVHFTEGLPNLPGYEEVPYADEWGHELAAWAAASWGSAISSSPPASPEARLRGVNGSRSAMDGAFTGITTRR